MKIVDTELAGVVEVLPARHGDHRGWFSEVFKRDVLREHGIDIDWIQDNESLSATVGTVRGIHYQVGPLAQSKLVRAISGSIFDVAVDLRRTSPNFGRHVTATLTAEAGNQLLVPAGFGHAFMTMEPDTHVAYKVDAPYAPDAERAIRWDDPELGIAWPTPAAGVELSDKDRVAPPLADQPDLFD